VVLCHPIKAATEVAHLLPRGGGAFLAEVDGNLTAWKDDCLISLHHSTKFRGAGFEAITFRLDKVLVEELKDSKGRMIPTVRAVPISEEEESNATAGTRSDDDLVLAEYCGAGDRAPSLADVARALGWFRSDGEPYKSKVQRAVGRLQKDGLVKSFRGDWVLTDKGKDAARSSDKTRGFGSR
jgi:hypothetical protein